MIADIVQTGLTSWWAPVLAFVAGLVSFASPCVFPLVPGYISFVSGERAVDGETERPLLPILLFIAGFTIVFTLLGAFAKRFVPIFKGDVGQWIGGAVVIAIGVFMIGYALRRGSITLYAERRPFLSKVRPGAIGALPLGMAFAAGWTPCLGPVLTGILAIAVTAEHRPRHPAAARVLAGARGAVPVGRAGGAALHGRVRVGPPPLRVDRRRVGSAADRRGRAAGDRGVHEDHRAAQPVRARTVTGPTAGPARFDGRP